MNALSGPSCTVHAFLLCLVNDLLLSFSMARVLWCVLWVVFLSPMLQWPHALTRVLTRSSLRSVSPSPCFSTAVAGPIPPELGQLHALQQLSLGGNNFSGETPCGTLMRPAVHVGEWGYRSYFGGFVSHSVRVFL